MSDKIPPGMPVVKICISTTKAVNELRQKAKILENRKWPVATHEIRISDYPDRNKNRLVIGVEGEKHPPLDEKITDYIFINPKLNPRISQIIRLIQHKEKGVIGARLKSKGELLNAGIAGQYLSSGDKKLLTAKLIEVDFVTSDIMRVPAEIFKKIPFPWFLSGYAAYHWFSEDEYFCNLVKQFGFKIWFDHHEGIPYHH